MGENPQERQSRHAEVNAGHHEFVGEKGSENAILAHFSILPDTEELILVLTSPHTSSQLVLSYRARDASILVYLYLGRLSWLPLFSPNLKI